MFFILQTLRVLKCVEYKLFRGRDLDVMFLVMRILSLPGIRELCSEVRDCSVTQAAPVLPLALDEG